MYVLYYTCTCTYMYESRIILVALIFSDVHVGIVFDDLDDSDDTLEYTLRLRHEVGNDDSWETRQAGPPFQLPGPRIGDKSVT